jgi:hypothetical protein
MAVVSCVSIALAIGTLGDGSCLLGSFKFNLTLLKEFNIEYIFVVRGGFQVDKKDRERELGYMMFDVIYIGNCMA